MSTRGWVTLATMWLISLIAVGASAQARRWTPNPWPKVFFGDDVGFRVDGLYGEVPSGTIVVRVKGEWVEAQVGSGKPDLIR